MDRRLRSHRKPAGPIDEAFFRWKTARSTGKSRRLARKAALSVGRAPFLPEKRRENQVSGLTHQKNARSSRSVRFPSKTASDSSLQGCVICELGFLAEDRHQAGIGDTRVLGQKRRIEDAGCSDDDPIGRIAMEGIRQSGDLSSDRRSDRLPLYQRRSSCSLQPFPQWQIQLNPLQADQGRNLPKGDVGDPDRLRFAGSLEQRLLLWGQPQSIAEPPEEYVSVQKGLHRFGPPSASQSSAGSTGPTMSPRILTVPLSDCCGYFSCPKAGGTTRATGRPRLRMRTASPVRSTSSRIAKHFALNSEARISRM